MSESIRTVILDHISQSLLVVCENNGNWRITTETVVLTVEILHQLCESSEETEVVLKEVDTKWKELIDKNFGLLSLPFMQLYHFILDHHLLLSYESCLRNIVACLRSVPYSSVSGSKPNTLWGIGLRLILSIIKSIPTVDELFKQEFAELIKTNELPTDLQSLVIAIGSFYSESPQINHLVYSISS